MRKKITGNGRPLEPYKGQLWFEPVSRSMRRWDGTKWAELNGSKALADAVRDICKEDSDAKK
jgi:hypothetical protein